MGSYSSAIVALNALNRIYHEAHEERHEGHEEKIMIVFLLFSLRVFVVKTLSLHRGVITSVFLSHR